jgi:DNA-directed RNA polymerase specialized sigma24 family protein
MTFEEFARSQLRALLAFATVLTGQRATAEDLAQEVLLRAQGRWDRIGRLDRPDFYVRKMLLNEFLTWRRRSWRLVPAGDRDQSAGPAPDHATGYCRARGDAGRDRQAASAAARRGGRGPDDACPCPGAR